MALTGTLINEILIKSDGDAFLDRLAYKPYTISDISPLRIQSVDLVDGEWGSAGSVIIWNYLQDGANGVAKYVIEALDMEKKTMTYKVVDGTLMDLYRSFFLTINVDIKGDLHLVTWTLDYEKLNETIEDPNTLMKLCLDLTNDIDNYQLNYTI